MDESSLEARVIDNLRGQIKELCVRLRHLENDYALAQAEARAATNRYLDVLQEVREKNAQLEHLKLDLEWRVAERTQQLRMEEDLYRTTINTLDDWIYVIDQDLRFVFMNECCRAMNRKMGYPEDVRNRSFPEVYPEWAADSLEEYCYVFESGVPVVRVEELRLRATSFMAEIRKLPVVENGKVVRVVTLIKDLSALYGQPVGVQS